MMGEWQTKDNILLRFQLALAHPEKLFPGGTCHPSPPGQHATAQLSKQKQLNEKIKYWKNAEIAIAIEVEAHTADFCHCDMRFLPLV